MGAKTMRARRRAVARLVRAALALWFAGAGGMARAAGPPGGPMYNGVQAGVVTCVDQNGNYTGCGAVAGGPSTANQGAPGTLPWLVMLYQGGAALSSTNPLPAQLYGTLPPFAATPTVNLGTLNGAALDSSLQAIKTILGAPFQSGGAIANTGFNALQGGAANAIANPFFVQVTNFPGTQAVTETTIDGNFGAQGDTPIQTSGASGSLLAQVKGILARILQTQAGAGGNAPTAGAVQGVINALGLPGEATNAAGGLAPPVNGTLGYRLVSSAATTNAFAAKASVGRVYKVYGCNTTTSDIILHLSNAASATPGTTAVVYSLVFPASATAGKRQCQSFDGSDIGYSFTSGISGWLSTGDADTDTSALAAGALVHFEVVAQ